MRALCGLLCGLFFAQVSYANDGWKTETLSFEFRSKSNGTSERVVRDEYIEISPFETPDREGLNALPVFRLIFGKDSLGIFDALKKDEVAGLTRSDAQKHIQLRHSEGKSEAQGAFIAGLTNLNDREMFMFFNLTRMKGEEGMAFRLITHEPLHLARLLITTYLNPLVDYLKDPYTKLEDENEEFFGETLERIATIAWNRYQQILENGQAD